MNSAALFRQKPDVRVPSKNACDFSHRITLTPGCSSANTISGTGLSDKGKFWRKPEYAKPRD